MASAQSFITAASANEQSVDRSGHTGSPNRWATPLNAMLDPANRVVSRVVIPEGPREDQVVKRLTRTDVSASRFNRAIRNADQLGLPKFAGNAEGSLFPRYV